ncbi:unnamed protein product [Hymenolepis diminuta]|uniref:Uncharacterized protein n=1 Tax=Hymenolepis diminuta TaxID=6216 RepID=A0A564Z5C9_HYMDI|nr:unnamed protein product [Hymenolepis diminuta]
MNVLFLILFTIVITSQSYAMPSLLEMFDEEGLDTESGPYLDGKTYENILEQIYGPLEYHGIY